MDANARTWKTIAKKYRWVLSRCDHNVQRLSVWQRGNMETITGLRAEVARLKELQPCGHPIQAIRSTPYIGDQHSNYCGWCLDVTRFECEHQLCQSLTAELLAYRERVARLREALEGLALAADCTWEDRNEGHDWADAVAFARTVMSETTAIGETPTE